MAIAIFDIPPIPPDPENTCRPERAAIRLGPEYRTLYDAELDRGDAPAMRTHAGRTGLADRIGASLLASRVEKLPRLADEARCAQEARN